MLRIGTVYRVVSFEKKTVIHLNLQCTLLVIGVINLLCATDAKFTNGDINKKMSLFFKQ